MKATVKPKSQPNTDSEIWELRLYVAGQTPKSIKAFANLNRICEEKLAGRYRIEVMPPIEISSTDPNCP